jgi:hypothetical protein
MAESGLNQIQKENGKRSKLARDCDGGRRRLLIARIGRGNYRNR